MNQTRDLYTFTVRYGRKVPSILTDVCLSRIVPTGQELTEDDVLTVPAVWDTGATISVISNDVVNNLRLSPTGAAVCYTVNGPRVVARYSINIHLPNQFAIPGLRVVDGDIHDAGILIGMDIIGRGDFAITHEYGSTCFSFQIPSSRTLDFKSEAQTD